MPDPIFGASGATATPVAPEPRGNSALGKEEFLKLLVAQLRNQDPLNPTNPEEMAAQLAQFSSLEQLIAVNENLETQTTSNSSMASAMNNTAAVGVLGKTVLAIGDTVGITGSADDTITVGVEGRGGSGTLRLFDANGAEVGSYEIGQVGGGRQELPLGEISEELEPGQYTYELDVTDSTGEALTVQTLTRTRVDGLRYGPAGPLLVAGDLEIPLANVVEIIADQAISITPGVPTT